jgi:hypothetical protein
MYSDASNKPHILSPQSTTTDSVLLAQTSPSDANKSTSDERNSDDTTNTSPTSLGTPQCHLCQQRFADTNTFMLHLRDQHGMLKRKHETMLDVKEAITGRSASAQDRRAQGSKSKTTNKVRYNICINIYATLLQQDHRSDGSVTSTTRPQQTFRTQFNNSPLMQTLNNIFPMMNSANNANGRIGSS